MTTNKDVDVVTRVFTTLLCRIDQLEKRVTAHVAKHQWLSLEEKNLQPKDTQPPTVVKKGAAKPKGQKGYIENAKLLVPLLLAHPKGLDVASIQGLLPGRTYEQGYRLAKSVAAWAPFVAVSKVNRSQHIYYIHEARKVEAQSWLSAQTKRAPLPQTVVPTENPEPVQMQTAIPKTEDEDYLVWLTIAKNGDIRYSTRLKDLKDHFKRDFGYPLQESELQQVSVQRARYMKHTKKLCNNRQPQSEAATKGPSALIGVDIFSNK